MLQELKKEIRIDLQNTSWDEMRVKLDTTRDHFLQFLANGQKPDASNGMQSLVGYTSTTVKSMPISIETEPFTLIVATNAARIEGAPMNDDHDIDIILFDERTQGKEPKTTTFTLPTKDKFARFNHFEQLNVYKGLVLMGEDLIPLIDASPKGEAQITTAQESLIEAFPPSTGA
jgi:hypothetical protein